MSRCYALKKDGHPCRNYATLVSEDTYSHTCRFHKDYFNDWREKIPRLSRNLSFNSIRRNHLESVLRDGISTVPEEYIRNLHPNPGYAPVFLFLYLARYQDNYDPQWNLDMHRRCIRALWWMSRAVGPVTVMFSDIITMISRMKTVLTPIALFKEMIRLFPIKRHPEPFKDQWEHYINLYLDSDVGKLALFDSDLLTTEKYILPWAQENGANLLVEMITSNEYDRILKDKKKKEYEAIKRRMDCVKEELMMVTWHPDRHIEWCLDIQEKAFIYGY